MTGVSGTGTNAAENVGSNGSSGSDYQYMISTGTGSGTTGSGTTGSGSIGGGSPLGTSGGTIIGGIGVQSITLTSSTIEYSISGTTIGMLDTSSEASGTGTTDFLASLIDITLLTPSFKADILTQRPDVSIASTLEGFSSPGGSLSIFSLDFQPILLVNSNSRAVSYRALPTMMVAIYDLQAYYALLTSDQLLAESRTYSLYQQLSGLISSSSDPTPISQLLAQSLIMQLIEQKSSFDKTDNAYGTLAIKYLETVILDSTITDPLLWVLPYADQSLYPISYQKDIAGNWAYHVSSTPTIITNGVLTDYVIAADLPTYTNALLEANARYNDFLRVYQGVESALSEKASFSIYYSELDNYQTAGYQAIQPTAIEIAGYLTAFAPIVIHPVQDQSGQTLSTAQLAALPSLYSSSTSEESLDLTTIKSLPSGFYREDGSSVSISDLSMYPDLVLVSSPNTHLTVDQALTYSSLSAVGIKSGVTVVPVTSLIGYADLYQDATLMNAIAAGSAQMSNSGYYKGIPKSLTTATYSDICSLQNPMLYSGISLSTEEAIAVDQVYEAWNGYVAAVNAASPLLIGEDLSTAQSGGGLSFATYRQLYDASILATNAAYEAFYNQLVYEIIDLPDTVQSAFAQYGYLNTTTSIFAAKSICANADVVSANNNIYAVLLSSRGLSSTLQSLYSEYQNQAILSQSFINHKFTIAPLSTQNLVLEVLDSNGVIFEIDFKNYQPVFDSSVTVEADFTPVEGSYYVLSQTSNPHVLATNLLVTLSSSTEQGGQGISNLVITLPSIQDVTLAQNVNYAYDFQWAIPSSAPSGWSLSGNKLVYKDSTENVVIPSVTTTFNIPLTLNKYAYYGLNTPFSYVLNFPAGVSGVQGLSTQNLTLKIGDFSFIVGAGQILDLQEVATTLNAANQQFYVVQKPGGEILLIQPYGPQMIVQWTGSSGFTTQILPLEAQWIPVSEQLIQDEVYTLRSATVPGITTTEPVEVINSQGTIVAYQSTNLDTALVSTGMGIDGLTPAGALFALKNYPINISYEQVAHYGFGTREDQILISQENIVPANFDPLTQNIKKTSFLGLYNPLGSLLDETIYMNIQSDVTATRSLSIVTDSTGSVLVNPEGFYRIDSSQASLALYMTQLQSALSQSLIGITSQKTINTVTTKFFQNAALKLSDGAYSSKATLTYIDNSTGVISADLNQYAFTDATQNMTGSILQKFYDQYFTNGISELAKSLYIVAEPYQKTTPSYNLVGSYGNTSTSSSGQSIDILYQKDVTIMPVADPIVNAKCDILRYFLTNGDGFLNGLLEITCDIVLDMGDPQGNSNHLVQIVFDGYGKIHPLLTKAGSFSSTSHNWSIVQNQTELTFSSSDSNPIIFQTIIPEGTKNIVTDRIQFTVDVGYLLREIYQEYAQLTSSDLQTAYLATAFEGIQFNSSMTIYSSYNTDFSDITAAIDSTQALLVEPTLILVSGDFLSLQQVNIGSINTAFVTSSNELGSLVITQGLDSVTVPLGKWPGIGNLNTWVAAQLTSAFTENPSLGLSVAFDTTTQDMVLETTSKFAITCDHQTSNSHYGFSNLSYNFSSNLYHAAFNFNTTPSNLNDLLVLRPQLETLTLSSDSILAAFSQKISDRISGMIHKNQIITVDSLLQNNESIQDITNNLKGLFDKLQQDYLLLPSTWAVFNIVPNTMFSINGTSYGAYTTNDPSTLQYNFALTTTDLNALSYSTVMQYDFLPYTHNADYTYSYTVYRAVDPSSQIMPQWNIFKIDLTITTNSGGSKTTTSFYYLEIDTTRAILNDEATNPPTLGLTVYTNALLPLFPTMPQDSDLIQWTRYQNQLAQNVAPNLQTPIELPQIAQISNVKVVNSDPLLQIYSTSGSSQDLNAPWHAYFTAKRLINESSFSRLIDRINVVLKNYNVKVDPAATLMGNPDFANRYVDLDLSPIFTALLEGHKTTIFGKTYYNFEALANDSIYLHFKGFSLEKHGEPRILSNYSFENQQQTKDTSQDPTNALFSTYALTGANLIRAINSWIDNGSEMFNISISPPIGFTGGSSYGLEYSLNKILTCYTPEVLIMTDQVLKGFSETNPILLSTYVSLFNPYDLQGLGYSYVDHPTLDTVKLQGQSAIAVNEAFNNAIENKKIFTLGERIYFVLNLEFNVASQNNQETTLLLTIAPSHYLDQNFFVTPSTSEQLTTSQNLNFIHQNAPLDLSKMSVAPPNMGIDQNDGWTTSEMNQTDGSITFLRSLKNETPGSHTEQLILSYPISSLPGSIIMGKDLTETRQLIEYFNALSIQINTQTSSAVNTQLYSSIAESQPTDRLIVDFDRGQSITVQYPKETEVQINQTGVHSLVRYESSGFDVGSDFYTVLSFVPLGPAFEKLGLYVYDNHGRLRSDIWNNLEVSVTVASGKDYFAGQLYLPIIYGDAGYFNVVNPSSGTGSSGGVQSAPSDAELAGCIRFVLTGANLQDMYKHWLAYTYQSNSKEYQDFLNQSSIVAMAAANASNAGGNQEIVVLQQSISETKKEIKLIQQFILENQQNLQTSQNDMLTQSNSVQSQIAVKRVFDNSASILQIKLIADYTNYAQVANLYSNSQHILSNLLQSKGDTLATVALADKTTMPLGSFIASNPIAITSSTATYGGLSPSLASTTSLGSNLVKSTNRFAVDKYALFYDTVTKPIYVNNVLTIAGGYSTIESGLAAASGSASIITNQYVFFNSSNICQDSSNGSYIPYHSVYTYTPSTLQQGLLNENRQFQILTHDALLGSIFHGSNYKAMLLEYSQNNHGSMMSFLEGISKVQNPKLDQYEAVALPCLKNMSSTTLGNLTTYSDESYLNNNSIFSAIMSQLNSITSALTPANGGFSRYLSYAALISPAPTTTATTSDNDTTLMVGVFPSTTSVSDYANKVYANITFPSLVSVAANTTVSSFLQKTFGLSSGQIATIQAIITQSVSGSYAQSADMETVSVPSLLNLVTYTNTDTTNDFGSTTLGSQSSSIAKVQIIFKSQPNFTTSELAYFVAGSNFAGLSENLQEKVSSTPIASKDTYAAFNWNNSLYGTQSFKTSMPSTYLVFSGLNVDYSKYLYFNSDQTSLSSATKASAINGDTAGNVKFLVKTEQYDRLFPAGHGSAHYESSHDNTNRPFGGGPGEAAGSYPNIFYNTFGSGSYKPRFKARRNWTWFDYSSDYYAYSRSSPVITFKNFSSSTDISSLKAADTVAAKGLGSWMSSLYNQTNASNNRALLTSIAALNEDYVSVLKKQLVNSNSLVGLLSSNIAQANPSNMNYSYLSSINNYSINAYALGAALKGYPTTFNIGPPLLSAFNYLGTSTYNNSLTGNDVGFSMNMTPKDQVVLSNIIAQNDSNFSTTININPIYKLSTVMRGLGAPTALSSILYNVAAGLQALGPSKTALIIHQGSVSSTDSTLGSSSTLTASREFFDRTAISFTNSSTSSLYDLLFKGNKGSILTDSIFHNLSAWGSTNTYAWTDPLSQWTSTQSRNFTSRAANSFSLSSQGSLSWPILLWTNAYQMQRVDFLQHIGNYNPMNSSNPNPASLYGQKGELLQITYELDRAHKLMYNRTYSSDVDNSITSASNYYNSPTYTTLGDLVVPTSYNQVLTATIQCANHLRALNNLYYWDYQLGTTLLQELKNNTSILQTDFITLGQYAVTQSPYINNALEPILQGIAAGAWVAPVIPGATNIINNFITPYQIGTTNYNSLMRLFYSNPVYLIKATDAEDNIQGFSFAYPQTTGTQATYSPVVGTAYNLSTSTKMSNVLGTVQGITYYGQYYANLESCLNQQALSSSDLYAFYLQQAYNDVRLQTPALNPLYSTSKLYNAAYYQQMLDYLNNMVLTELKADLSIQESQLAQMLLLSGPGLYEQLLKVQAAQEELLNLDYSQIAIGLCPYNLKSYGVSGNLLINGTPTKFMDDFLVHTAAVSMGIANAGSLSPLIPNTEPAGIPTLTLSQFTVNTNRDGSLTGIFTIRVKFDFYIDNLSGNENTQLKMRIFYTDDSGSMVNLPVESAISIVKTGDASTTNPWSIDPLATSAGSVSSSYQFVRDRIVLPKDPSKTQTQVTTSQLTAYKTALEAARHFQEEVEIQVHIYDTILPLAGTLIPGTLVANAELQIYATAESSAINKVVSTSLTLQGDNNVSYYPIAYLDENGYPLITDSKSLFNSIQKGRYNLVPFLLDLYEKSNNTGYYDESVVKSSKIEFNAQGKQFVQFWMGTPTTFTDFGSNLKTSKVQNDLTAGSLTGDALWYIYDKWKNSWFNSPAAVGYKYNQYVSKIHQAQTNLDALIIAVWTKIYNDSNLFNAIAQYSVDSTSFVPGIITSDQVTAALNLSSALSVIETIDLGIFYDANGIFLKGLFNKIFNSEFQINSLSINLSMDRTLSDKEYIQTFVRTFNNLSAISGLWLENSSGTAISIHQTNPVQAMGRGLFEWYPASYFSGSGSQFVFGVQGQSSRTSYSYYLVNSDGTLGSSSTSFSTLKTSHSNQWFAIVHMDTQYGTPIIDAYIYYNSTVAAYQILRCNTNPIQISLLSSTGAQSIVSPGIMPVNTQVQSVYTDWLHLVAKGGGVESLSIAPSCQKITNLDTFAIDTAGQAWILNTANTANLLSSFTTSSAFLSAVGVIKPFSQYLSDGHAITGSDADNFFQYYDLTLELQAAQDGINTILNSLNNWITTQTDFITIPSEDPRPYTEVFFWPQYGSDSDFIITGTQQVFGGDIEVLPAQVFIVGPQPDFHFDTTITSLSVGGLRFYSRFDQDYKIFTTPRGTFSLNMNIAYQNHNIYNSRRLTLVLQIANGNSYDITAIPRGNDSDWVARKMYGLSPTSSYNIIDILNWQCSSGILGYTVHLTITQTQSLNSYSIDIPRGTYISDCVNIINTYSFITGLYAISTSDGQYFRTLFLISDPASTSAFSNINLWTGDDPANKAWNLNFAPSTTEFTDPSTGAAYLIYTKEFPEGFGSTVYANNFTFSFDLNKARLNQSGIFGFSEAHLISTSNPQNEDLSPGPVLSSISSPTQQDIANAILPDNLVLITGASSYRLASGLLTNQAYTTYTPVAAASQFTSSARYFSEVGQNAYAYSVFIVPTSSSCTHIGSRVEVPITNLTIFTSTRSLSTSGVTDYGYNILEYYNRTQRSDISSPSILSTNQTQRVNYSTYDGTNAYYSYKTVSYLSTFPVNYIGSETNFDFLVGSASSDILMAGRGTQVGVPNNPVYLALQTDFSVGSGTSSALGYSDKTAIQNIAARDVLVGGSGDDCFYTHNGLLNGVADILSANALDYNINVGCFVVSGPGNNDIYSGYGGSVLCLTSAVALQGYQMVNMTTPPLEVEAGNAILGSDTNIFRFMCASVDNSVSGLVPAIFSAGSVSTTAGSAVTALTSNSGYDVIHYSLDGVIPDSMPNRDIIYFFKSPDKIDLSVLFDQLGIPVESRSLFNPSNTLVEPGVIYLEEISSTSEFHPLANSDVETATQISVHYAGHSYYIADVYGFTPIDFLTVVGSQLDATSNYFITV